MDYLTKIILFFNNQLEPSDPEVKRIKQKIFSAALLVSVGLLLIFLIKQVNPSTDNILLMIILTIGTILIIFLTSFLRVRGILKTSLTFGALVIMFILLLIIYDESYQNRLDQWLNSRTSRDVDELYFYFYSDSSKTNLISSGAIEIDFKNKSTFYQLTGQKLLVPISPRDRGETITIYPNIPAYKSDEIQFEVPLIGKRYDFILHPKFFHTKVTGRIIPNNGKTLDNVREIEWGGVKLEIDSTGKYKVDLPFKSGTLAKMVIIMSDGSTKIRNNEIIPSQLPHEIFIY